MNTNMLRVHHRSGLFLCLLCLVDTNAQGQWDQATNTGMENSGDPMLTRCKFQTLGGYKFSALYSGFCPFSVEVNPETGKVRATQPESPSSQRTENATIIGQESTGDPMLTRCIYQTLGGYRFTINHRGQCAFNVMVNPESGKAEASPSDSLSEAVGRWENAINIKQTPIGGSLLNRCHYQTLGGYRFTTTSRSLCQYSVSVNSETRQVRE